MPLLKGVLLWCQLKLYQCISQTTPGPCFLALLVLQLTLYTKGEFLTLLQVTHSMGQAVTLPVMVRVSLATSVVTKGMVGG